MTAEDYANVLSFGISILFFGYAASLLIDELKDYFIDKLRRKHLKEIEQ